MLSHAHRLLKARLSLIGDFLDSSLRAVIRCATSLVLRSINLLIGIVKPYIVVPPPATHPKIWKSSAEPIMITAISDPLLISACNRLLTSKVNPFFKER